MLCELRVENLLLIERAELRLTEGLNVLTGETGAGKTVLAHALDLLLGGKARPGIVRPGAAEAYVEGIFALPADLREELGDRLPEEAEELVLARRVSAEGRTRAYLGGRAATAADLRDVGGRLVSFYGQHEHRRLTLASSQLEILDGFCGPEQAGRRAAFAGLYARERALAAELEALQARAGGAGPRDRPARVGAGGDRRRRAVTEEEEALARSASGCATSRACAPRRAAASRRSRRGRRRRGEALAGALAPWR
jgi:DNA repair protein RecN (Recombination protein N)